MALLAANVVTTAAGIVPTYSSANASDTFPAGNYLLLVENSNAATRTITITTTPTSRGLSIPDPSNTIGATTGRLTFGPFPSDLYADPTTGLVTVTPSATAGITYALIQFSSP